jgi:uncharacterized iron-regulated membrane protein
MKILDLLHRWTGGIIGLVLAVLGFSGAVLVHRDAWVMLPHAGDAQVQGTAAIAAAATRIMANPNDRPQSITFANANFGLDRLAFKQGAGAYTDQAGGPVTTWSSQWERPEIWIFDLHHHLFAGDTGETVIGVAAVAGIFFVITGAILWWRTRRTFELRLLPKRMSRSSILRHHRDLGIVAAPLLLLSFATGSMLVFRPLTAVILGPSAPALITQKLQPPPARPEPLARQPDWAAMIGAARAVYPDAEIRSLSLPRDDNGLITLRMKRPEEWLPNGRTTVWFAANTGQLIKSRDAAALPAIVKIYNMLYPLHAGKVGGLTYRLVMTLSGLALGLLGTLTVWTFWFRRSRVTRR